MLPHLRMIYNFLFKSDYRLFFDKYLPKYLQFINKLLNVSINLRIYIYIPVWLNECL